MSKMNEFIDVSIPGDSSKSGFREYVKIHYSQIIFNERESLCYVNYLGTWVIPNEMNWEIIRLVREIENAPQN